MNLFWKPAISDLIVLICHFSPHSLFRGALLEGAQGVLGFDLSCVTGDGHASRRGPHGALPLQVQLKELEHPI